MLKHCQEESYAMENILSKEFLPYNITDFFSPFNLEDQPCLVEMPENPNLWIPVFSTVSALEAHCERVGITEYKIKKIDDGFDFIDSLTPYGIRIMANPYIFNGNTRWTEVLES